MIYLKVQSFRLIMENNFIQIAASAGHAVAYIECSFGCVARSAVLLKPNVANILFNFCEQKFVQHGPITIAIDCNASSCSFTKQNGLWTKIRTKQWFVLGASAFQCMRAGFLCLKCDNFACLSTRQRFIWKNDFLAKIDIFCKSIAGPLSEALFKRVHNHIHLAKG